MFDKKVKVAVIAFGEGATVDYENSLFAVDNGYLTVYNDDITLAVYAPGYWVSAKIVD